MIPLKSNLTCDNIIYNRATGQIKLTNFLCATETIDSLRRRDFNYTKIADFHYQECRAHLINFVLEQLDNFWHRLILDF